MSEAIQAEEKTRAEDNLIDTAVVSRVSGVVGSAGAAAVGVPEQEHYAEKLARSLTSTNLEATLQEIDRLSTDKATTSPINTQYQVHFLASLFTELLKHLPQQATRATKNHKDHHSQQHHQQQQQQPSSNAATVKTQIKAIDATLVQLANTHSFITRVCLAVTTATEGEEQSLVQLLKYLVSISTTPGKSSKKAVVSDLGLIILCAAVCSGWITQTNHLNNHDGEEEEESSTGIEFACETLVSVLEKQQKGITSLDTLPCAVQQGVIFATLSRDIFISNKELREPAENIINSLNKKMSSDKEGFYPLNAAAGMAERLSPAMSSAGIGITNLLADWGPVCTQNASTLRNTIREITRTLPSINRGESSTIDEKAMARLIYFFSERGTTTREDSRKDGDGSANTWNRSVISEVLSTDYSQLNWAVVADSFDFADFYIRDAAHFLALLQIYKSAAKNNLPDAPFVKEWQYKSGQLSFLANALTMSKSVFTFTLNDDETADASTSGDLPASANVNPQGWASTDVLKILFVFSDDPELARRVRELFVKGLLTCPEVLLCAICRQGFNMSQQNGPVSNAGAQLRAELMRELIPMFFTQQNQHSVKNGPAAILRLWSTTPTTVILASIQTWKSIANESTQIRYTQAVHLSNIIRFLPQESSMPKFLSSDNHDFSIAIAFILADGGFLDLKPWFNERLEGGGVTFIEGLISYVGRNYTQAMPRETKGVAALLTIENMARSLQFLQNLDSSILEKEVQVAADSTMKRIYIGDRVKTLMDTCLATHPSLNSVIPRKSTSNIMPDSPSHSSEDIEEMANSYFQKIYTSEQSIEDVVEMLKNFKTSGKTKENEIFACMIHNLFDEYRFFSKYPEKELRITGILFGKLIQHQLVNSITLGIALRYVLEALRKPPNAANGSTTTNGGKMFRFGMFALEQFKDRLHEWPQYCSHIVQIPHLKDGYASLIAEIEGAMAENLSRNVNNNSIGYNDGNSVISEKSATGDKVVVEGVPSSVDILLNPQSNKGSVSSTPEINGGLTGQVPALPDMPLPPVTAEPIVPVRKVAEFGPGLGRAVNGKHDETEPEAPPGATLDRVQFLINNMSLSNVEQKARELREMLSSEYFGWLGQYLVVKRISTQPNFHSLYLAFLEQLGDYGKGLLDAILSSAYMNIGKLLRSPKITTSTSERSLLKNLGSWLGQITLAVNRPILQITLDCKELLFQGYETGMLIAVTPFVAKILEGAKKSIVFRPPNPWLMGLLSVFRALYGVDDLKMNIKFEVEVLCKNLGVKLEDIPLRIEDLTKRLPPVKTNNPDFNIKSTVSSQSSTGASTSGTTNSARNTPAADSKQASSVLPHSTPSGSSLQVTSPSSGTNSQDQQQTQIPNLASYVTINSSLSQLFQHLTQGSMVANINSAVLKRNVPIAVDRAIREVIQPVVERSVTIACITTKEIVTKDFAMEGDENKMRKAAQLMVANLAGSLALVTCREPLRASVSANLRQLLSNSIGISANSEESKLSDQEQNVLDQCIQICSQDNLELGCMLIEKAATEKAVRDMDDALAPALSKRKSHREQTGKSYYDMTIFGNGNQRYPAALPEPLRPKPVGLRNDQLLVYDAFQRLPRQPSVPNQQQRNSANTSPTSLGVGSAPALPSSSKAGTKVNVEALSTIAAKLDATISSLLNAAGPRAAEIALSMLPPDHEIKSLLLMARQMTTSVALNGALSSTETDSVLGFAQSIFKRLYELRISEPLRLEAFVALLEALNECCRQLGNDLGTWATYAPTETDDQRKLHQTVLSLLLRSKLVKLADLDEYLYRNTDGGRNMIWLEFTLTFIRKAVMDKVINPSELGQSLPQIMEVFTKVSQGSSQDNQVSQLLRFIQECSGSTPTQESKTQGSVDSSSYVKADGKPTHQQSSSISPSNLNTLAEATKHAADAISTISRDDPPGLKQQVMILLDRWLTIGEDSTSNDKSLQFVQLLYQNGVGKNEEQTERFFRLSTEIIVNAVLKSANDSNASSQKGQTRALNYSVIDQYCKLVSLAVRHLNSGGSNEQIGSQRVSLLNKILGVSVRTMMAHFEYNKRNNNGQSAKWDQRPWFRLFLNLVLDLNSPSSTLDPISYGILSVFGSAFHVVQPLVIPGFAFAWLELVSHRMFLSNLLLVKGQKGWALAHQLLIDLFLFLEPHLRKMELTDAMRHLYKGTLRVLLVLLHDFPSFLAGYHLSFCNVIPENCVQLRNLILSAFPRGMVLPDPFTPNLKIDLLPDISKSPVVLSNVAGPLTAMRNELDNYLKNHRPTEFLHGLLPRLCKDGTQEIDVARVNALVLYVGMHAIASLQNSQISQSLAHTAEIEILKKLMDFNDSGRYISLNAIANQLRYPSSHTHYYSCVMLFLFSEAKDEGVREQVTRVLLERLIVHRPHPWGLLITFIELIKNQRYQFWSHPFTRCATEIEKVFESVARSCMTPGSQRSTTSVDITH